MFDWAKTLQQEILLELLSQCTGNMTMSELGFQRTSVSDQTYTKEQSDATRPKEGSLQEMMTLNAPKCDIRLSSQ